MRWSVVVPSARAENVVRSLTSLLLTHPGLETNRIIVIDDGAREAAEPLLPSGITWVRGEAPFIWARNVNRGFEAARDPAIAIMGDDVEIMTERGFDRLAEGLEGHPEIGALSTAVRGVVGNPRQECGRGEGLVYDNTWLAFVCVMVRRAAWDAIGPLDESFEGYGCDDVDYSWRLRDKGFRMGILHSSVVRHDGSIPSTYRAKNNVNNLSEAHRGRVEVKWGQTWR